MNRSAAFFLALGLSAPMAMAQPVEVDLELALMVDVSRSMSQRELEIQRQGYAAALRSTDVYKAIQTGLLQKIAVTYVEWAGTQEVIVDWQLLETPDDLSAFADRVEFGVVSSQRRTSISSALSFAAASVLENGFDGLRQVIDISGDGPNNAGGPVETVRDEVLEEGIVINGLPLMTRDGASDGWSIDRLDLYYQNCVIGGPGSFVMPVLEWEDFPEAVRRKLILEIASVGVTEWVVPAQAVVRDPRDCLVGEKIRADRDIWR